MRADMHSRLERRGDAALVNAVRDGDVTAFVTLAGRHQPAMRRLARILDPLHVHHDLTDEALAMACTSVSRGHGPETSLRPYLLRLVTHLHDLRTAGFTDPLAGEQAVFVADAFAGHADADGQGAEIVREVAGMPEAWQAVLWHLDVEQDQPARVATMLDIPVVAVLPLAERVHESLGRTAPESKEPGAVAHALATHLLDEYAAEYLTLAGAITPPPPQRSGGG